MTEAVQEIMKTEGIAGFFVGYAAMLVRDIPYTMIELGFYESIKAPVKRVRSYLTSSVKVGGGSDIVVDGESVSADDLIAAAITGVVAAVMTAPLDLIKTRMMMQVTSCVLTLSGNLSMS